MLNAFMRKSDQLVSMLSEVHNRGQRESELLLKFKNFKWELAKATKGEGDIASNREKGKEKKERYPWD